MTGCALLRRHLVSIQKGRVWLLPVTLEPDPCKLKFVSWLHPRAHLGFGSLLVDPANTQNRTQLISHKAYIHKKQPPTLHDKLYIVSLHYKLIVHIYNNHMNRE